MSIKLGDVNLTKSGVYELLNEGMGGAYERIAYSNMIDRLAKQFGCHSILELGATYIAGIPGFNSCLLAQRGYDVTVAVSERDFEDTKQVWALTGLNATIVPISRLPASKFYNGSYDLVYNHLAFEQQNNPALLVREMRRVARKVVINLTLSPYNYGFFIHWLGHRLYKKPYNHGYASKATIGAMVKVHEKEGLRVIETGTCDCPPWMDTVDGKIGNSMTYMDILPEKYRKKWVWTSVDPACQNHPQVKRMWEWEQNLPVWFKTIFAHHLYCAGEKP